MYRGCHRGESGDRAGGQFDVFPVFLAFPRGSVSSSRFESKLRKKPQSVARMVSPVSPFPRRVLQQRQFLRQWREAFHPEQAFRPTSALLNLVEKGVPPLLRRRVWPLLLGNVLKVTPEAFQLYWSRAQSGESETKMMTMMMSGSRGKEATVRLIEEDLKRTFVPLGFFDRGEPLHDVIRKMLLTYAYYRPDIGYVQGMSFIAGILAIHIWDDYLCFQCLANLLGSEHLYAFYSLKVEFRHVFHVARVYPAILRNLRLDFQSGKSDAFFVFPSIPPIFSSHFFSLDQRYSHRSVSV